jgi:hypothetical protein
MRLLLWIQPFLVGACLALETLSLFSPSHSSSNGLIAAGVGNLLLLCLLWLKYPWARERPIALVLFGIAGLGGTVGSFLAFAPRVLVYIFGEWGPLIGIMGLGFFAVGASLSIGIRARRVYPSNTIGAG